MMRDAYGDRYHPMQGVITGFVRQALMPHPLGLVVWDLGCGDGIFSGAFHGMGARSVLASDLQNIVSPELRQHIEFRQCDIDHAAEAFGADLIKSVDIVFMHLMTEHVSDLRGLFRSLARCLRPGTEIFVHHDCYQHPVGHHDHQLLFLDEPSWSIKPQGVRCWEMPEKCGASAAHRGSLSAYQWSAESEATRNPLRCDDCNYFRRSQPWAHLIYGNDYSRTFPEIWFRDELNRLTSSQVRWFAQEAGFSVTAEHRIMINNVPSDNLSALYGAAELRTFTYSMRAVKNGAVENA
ncbi:class I SAM-dependent methyltransferase [Inquilinus sp.]|uniref:class I SAM-dependent methyltransferase n=1 Tax=Inquilinus sp. TaxID=1932117 RepID=UPI0031CE7985